MKYVISWNERPQGSPAEYENAQTRSAGGRLGWAFVGGLRRSAGGSQVLLDASGISNGGTPRNCCPGCSPGRTRSNGLARRPEGQVTYGRLASGGWRTLGEPE